jgi:hypothetical protein
MINGQNINQPIGNNGSWKSLYPFKNQCKIMVNKREGHRVLCTMAPSFNHFVKNQFSVFIFAEINSLEDWSGFPLFIEEPLNERIEIGRFDDLEVVRIYEFANGRAAFMLYQDFLLIYGIPMFTNIEQIFKVDEVMIKLYKLELISKTRLVNIAIHNPLVIDEVWSSFRIKFDCNIGGDLIEWGSRLQKGFVIWTSYGIEGQSLRIVDLILQ